MLVLQLTATLTQLSPTLILSQRSSLLCPLRVPPLRSGSAEGDLAKPLQSPPAAAAVKKAASSNPGSALLQCSVGQLWDAAATFLHSGDGSDGGFLQSAQVQRCATAAIEECIRSELHSQSSIRRRTLLTANSTAHSSNWLTVLPTQPLYRMANASVRLAMRHRLGVLPYDSLLRDRCSCRLRTALSDDPDHFHSCVNVRGNILTQRHNNLTQVLQDLALHAGFLTVREPNTHIRPAEIERLPADSKGYNTHADLLLLRHDLKLYIDVAVTRPTNATLLTSSPTAVSTVPLYSTEKIARIKHSKYDEIARVNDYRMIPFIVESYGGIGAEAMQLLHTLAAHCKEYTPADFLQHAHNRISIALQSSNADIAQLSMQQHHLRQHCVFDREYDENQRRHDARNSAYAQPANGDQLERRVSMIVHAANAKARERGGGGECRRTLALSPIHPSAQSRIR